MDTINTQLQEMQLLHQPVLTLYFPSWSSSAVSLSSPSSPPSSPSLDEARYALKSMLRSSSFVNLGGRERRGEGGKEGRRGGRGRREGGRERECVNVYVRAK